MYVFIRMCVFTHACLVHSYIYVYDQCMHTSMVMLIYVDFSCFIIDLWPELDYIALGKGV